jgi:kelch-like protein 10
MDPRKSTRKPKRYETRQQSAIAREKTRCACEVTVPKAEIPVDFYEDTSWIQTLTVVSSDGQTSIRAHTVPFLGISDVFFQLYQSSKDIINVNIPPEYLELIVKFSYTLTCDITNENLIPLLEIAKEYKILYILKLCGSFLMKDLLSLNAFHALRMARQYLCIHVINKILSFITRNFVDIIQQNCTKEISLEDLTLITSSDELSIRENQLVTFIICWAQENQVSSENVRIVLDNVRFTKMSQTEYFSQLNHPVMRILLSNCPPPNSMTTAKIFHDPPVSTRSQARKKHRTYVEEPDRIPREMLVTMGGWTGNPPGPCTLLEAYNYLANNWMVLEDLELPHKSAYHGLELIDNKVYMVGGYDSTGPVYHNSLMCLDLRTKQWNELSQMDFKRCYVASTMLEGKIYAVGGHDGINRHKSVEVYHPDRNQWNRIPDLIHPRSDLACVSLQGKVFAIGGFTGSDVLTSIEMYDPQIGTWEIFDSLAIQRSGVKACVLGHRIYVLGGFDGSTRLKSVECFTPGVTRAVWHQVPDMKHPRSNFSVSVMDNKIYVSGGYADPSVSSACEMYCPVTNTWTEIPDMHHQKSALAQITISYQNVDSMASFIR